MRLYRSTLLICMIDMYYTPPYVKEAGIRIGEKNLRMDGTDTEREPKLIFSLVNCRLVRSQNFRKGIDRGAESVRRDVPHIKKCSPIRSTNLHYSSCYDDERSRPMEKIVTI